MFSAPIRFRDEVREERRGSADSPVQRAFNVASSSAILVVFLIVVLVAATIACLPLLLALKISSAVFSCAAHHDGVDSSVLPSFYNSLVFVVFGFPTLLPEFNVPLVPEKTTRPEYPNIELRG